MTNITKIARKDILKISPYIPGVYQSGFTRLNANESPWKALGDNTNMGLNRYPPPRPIAINNLLSKQYKVKQENIMITRGASEAIDIIIRPFCEPKKDKILICPPTFDMYRLYAEIQGALITKVPLLRNEDVLKDFSLDVQTIINQCDDLTKIIFVCTPNNPTGNSPLVEDIKKIAENRLGKSIIVIDEAYQEFSGKESLTSLQEKYNNIIVLRTLSKFVSLAGVRCGSIIAENDVIELLNKVLPPYTFPTPCIEEVTRALSRRSIDSSKDKVKSIKAEKQRFISNLSELSQVNKIWPSDANFFMAEVNNIQSFMDAAYKRKILVRSFPNEPIINNCIRITVGKKEENNALIQSIVDGE